MFRAIFVSVSVCLCLCLSVAYVSAADLPSALDVMRRVEANQRSPAEAIDFEMVLTDRSGFQRKRQVREFRRREPNGLESSLVFFDDPPDIRGTALLSRERPDGFDDQWLYLPAVGKIRRIAEGSRTDYFLGTDLTFEDFSVEDITHFDYRFSAPDTQMAGRPAHVIDAAPSDSAARRRSGYGVRRIFVDVERHVILRSDYFDRAGNHIKILMASHFVSYDSKIRNPKSQIPNPERAWRSDRIFVENFGRKHQTEIVVRRRSMSEIFPPDFFTPRTLQRGSPPEIFSRPPRAIPENP